MQNLETLIKRPEHLWEHVQMPPGSAFQKRSCPVCGMWDSRPIIRDVSTVEHGWSVTIPCIEQMLETMAYQDLLVYLFQNGGITLVPVSYGFPGHRIIGFQVKNGAMPYPRILVQNPQTEEQGWARLRDWVRVRGFDPYLYSDFDKYFSQDAPSLHIFSVDDLKQLASSSR
ncbi:MAG: hypothetical protein WCT54_02515 [Patescibacteria group bacterium]